MLSEIKICDWQIQKDTPQDGETNACIISFRIANIAGMNLFFDTFSDVLTSLSALKNFKSSNVILFFGRLAVDLYSALKSAKRKIID